MEYKVEYEDRELYTLVEAAEILDISYRSLMNLAKRGYFDTIIQDRISYEKAFLDGATIEAIHNALEPRFEPKRVFTGRKFYQEM